MRKWNFKDKYCGGHEIRNKCAFEFVPSEPNKKVALSVYFCRIIPKEKET
jgi:hypothetical protein